MNERVLEELGLEPEAVAVFHTACEGGDDVRATCVEAGHDGATTERIIRSLVGSGLVAPAGEGDNRLVPVHPGKVLARTVTSAHRQISEAEALFADLKAVQEELQQAFDQYEERTATQRVIEVIFGVEAVNARLDELPFLPSRCLRPGPPLYGSYLPRDVAQLATGHRDRTIYDHGRFADPGEWHRIAKLVSLGQEARVSHVPLPIRVVVMEDEYAVLPLTGSDDGGAGAMIVHSSSIVTALGALFEEIWRRSTPFAPDPQESQLTSDNGIATDEIALLNLLLLGLSDEQVARRLAVSARTVRRRISAMQERMGVSTRFQLAARSVANGWQPVGQPDQEIAWA